MTTCSCDESCAVVFLGLGTYLTPQKLWIFSYPADFDTALPFKWAAQRT